VGSFQFDGAEQGRRTGELHLSQELSDLLLWMHAFGKTAVSLENGRADSNGRIRLFGARPHDRGAFQRADIAIGGRTKAHPLCCRTVLLRGGKQPSNEEIIRIGIDQPSPIIPERDLCDDAFRLWRSIPQQGDGKLVVGCRARRARLNDQE
jgi:hypothetical protein